MKKPDTIEQSRITQNLNALVATSKSGLDELDRFFDEKIAAIEQEILSVSHPSEVTEKRKFLRDVLLAQFRPSQMAADRIAEFSPPKKPTPSGEEE